ncbi:putative reverse transcriptase domain-containing protein [Tanacetum coccineum]
MALKAPKRTTKSNPAAIATTASTDTTTIPATVTVTDAQLNALIKQGITKALAVRDNHLNGNGGHSSGGGSTGPVRPTRECTYADFLKCQPINFNGREGFTGLTQWFERMETVFDISKCAVENQVKFVACILHGIALTWWKSHARTKLEAEMWELKVKGTDLASYTQRFQELALLCGRMFLEEYDKIEKYVGGIPDMLYGSVMTSKPQIMQDAIKFATGLMDKKIRSFAERQTENKRKAYTDGPGEKKQYTGNKPLCQRATCYECGAEGYFKRDCPKLKNRNCGNQGGSGNAPAKVYAVGNVGTNPDSNVVMGTFLLNNRYASILFNTGADRSFVSTAFSSQIDTTPTTLDHFYDVELADGRIIGLNTIIQNCTLNFLNYSFYINLIPVELGSFCWKHKKCRSLLSCNRS